MYCKVVLKQGAHYVLQSCFKVQVFPGKERLSNLRMHRVVFLGFFHLVQWFIHLVGVIETWRANMVGKGSWKILYGIDRKVHFLNVQFWFLMADVLGSPQDSLHSGQSRGYYQEDMASSKQSAAQFNIQGRIGCWSCYFLTLINHQPTSELWVSPAPFYIIMTSYLTFGYQPILASRD